MISVGRSRNITPGQPGATSPVNVVGATSAGPPATGAWVVGDIAYDRSGTWWGCVFGGTPGVWVECGTRPGSVHFAVQSAWHSLLPYGASVDLTVTADRAYALPLRVDHTATITGVSVHVADAADSGNVRAGLYFDTGANAPGALIADWGTVSAATTGVKTLTPSQGIIGGTLYWLVIATQIVGVTALKARNSDHPYVVSTSAPTDFAAYQSAYYASAVSGALPASFGAPAGMTQAPDVYLKLL